jgi:hypothetical protein
MIKNTKIDEYAITVFVEDRQKDINEIINKIRILYRFGPEAEEIVTGIGAMTDMRLNIKRIMSTPKMLRLLNDDRKKFLALAERLTEKYSRKSSALRDLARGASPRKQREGGRREDLI